MNCTIFGFYCLCSVFTSHHICVFLLLLIYCFWFENKSWFQIRLVERFPSFISEVVTDTEGSRIDGVEIHTHIPATSIDCHLSTPEQMTTTFRYILDGWPRTASHSSARFYSKIINSYEHHSGLSRNTYLPAVINNADSGCLTT